MATEEYRSNTDLLNQTNADSGHSLGEGRRVEPYGTANLSLSWVGFISLIYTQDENWGKNGVVVNISPFMWIW